MQCTRSVARRHTGPAKDHHVPWHCLSRSRDDQSHRPVAISSLLWRHRQAASYRTLTSVGSPLLQRVARCRKLQNGQVSAEWQGNSVHDKLLSKTASKCALLNTQMHLTANLSFPYLLSTLSDYSTVYVPELLCRVQLFCPVLVF